MRTPIILYYNVTHVSYSHNLLIKKDTLASLEVKCEAQKNTQKRIKVLRFKRSQTILFRF